MSVHGSQTVSSAPAIEVSGLVKSYPGAVALKGVDFRADYGEIAVVMGENGAGKSTLMKILAGVETPTSGEVRIDGRTVRLRSVRDAESRGIAMVHQELNLLPNLSVTDNIFAGHEISHAFGWVRRRVEEQRGREALEILHHPLPPEQLVGSLPLGHQQIVELARAIARRSKILILDEPTSTLSSAEVEILFQVLDRLRRSGVCIIYISHRLREVLAIGERFTVLRDGCIAGRADRSHVDESWLVEQMTGRPALRTRSGSAPQQDRAVLSVAGLSLCSASGARRALSDVSFSLHRGEVLGVYGLLGAGRTELLECLSGARPGFTGRVCLEGVPVRLDTVAGALRKGVALVPEDRKRDGLVPELSVRENIALPGLRECCAGPWVLAKKERRTVEAWAARVNLNPACLDLPISALSGGNQQKAILLRCLLCRPRVLLLDEPTRGIDVGAKAEIAALLRSLAAEGLSVLFTTSEPEELLQIADRCLVLSRGVITRDCVVSEISEEELYIADSEKPERTGTDW